MIFRKLKRFCSGGVEGEWAVGRRAVGRWSGGMEIGD